MAPLSLTAFAGGLVSVCVPDDVHSPAYDDGEADGVGIAQERQTFTPYVGIFQKVGTHIGRPLLSMST
jgi:hypothetical protein